MVWKLILLESERKINKKNSSYIFFVYICDLFVAKPPNVIDKYLNINEIKRINYVLDT